MSKLCYNHNRREVRMDKNTKIIVIVILVISGIVVFGFVGIIAIYMDYNKRITNVVHQGDKENLRYVTDGKAKFVSKDTSGNSYYVVYVDTDEEQVLKIISTLDEKNYYDILDLTMSIYTGYEDAPYVGYKIESGAVFYINNYYNSGYNCSEELKVTLKDNKYNITSTGKTYIPISGMKC